MDLRPLLALGTLGWLIAFFVFLFTGDHGVWMWTCLAGAALGLIGFLIMGWQRAAARRGSRGAQDGL